jgi:lysophospholipid acyltransferase (LPLAT)-like uncharacterized protein
MAKGKKKGTEIRSSRKSVFLGKLIGHLMEWWCRTLDYEIEELSQICPSGKNASSTIFCFWHNRIFALPHLWRPVFGYNNQASVLTSASHDGDMLANAMKVFGLSSIRGSSSRRAVTALVQMRKALRQGIHIHITPDGPRGPRCELQPGVIMLAQTTGCSIVPVQCVLSAYWTLPTWDRFMIPLPYSKVKVIFQAPIAIPAELTEEEFEQTRKRLEDQLNQDQTSHPASF